MPSNQAPSQYAIIFKLLTDYAQLYSRQTEQVCRSLGKPWNPQTAPFEIDVHFAFQLSCSLLGLQHERTVWEELLLYCESQLLQRYAPPALSAADLSEVIVARIERYGEARNNSIDNGEERVSAELKWLGQHLSASLEGNEVVADPPIVLGGFFKGQRFILLMIPVEMTIAGEFCCCLKHLFQATSNIRTLTAARMKDLVHSGQKEARALAREDAPELTTALEEGLAILAEGERFLASGGESSRAA